METKDYSPGTVKNVVKSLDNFLWNIANNVVCTICQELFTEAATNQCGHSYCLKCIKKFHSTSKNGKINCPLCRRPIKRRSEVVNPVLSKIAAIFTETPTAFKEDVKRLTKSFEGVGEDLIKSSRISGICDEKIKTDVVKKGRGRPKKNAPQTTSHDSIVFCSITSNEDSADLKSISQMESKSELYVSDSPDVQKKLRNVKGIPSKEKVSNWLKNVDRNIVSTPTPSENEVADKSFTEPNDNKANISSMSSMIRIDYTKSKPPILSNDKTLTLGQEDDPYEFIASQRNTPPKKKRCPRGRKKVVPQFEAVQSFGKTKIKKPDADTSGVFDDDGSSIVNIQKPVRTYSIRSNRTRTVVNKEENMSVEDTVVEKPSKAINNSVGSSLVIETAEDESDIIVKKPAARRRLLSSGSEDNSDSKGSKKQKLETDEGIGEKGRKSVGGSKCSESPGWSRVSNLKLDFESANKRKPCRKTLNISGGELNTSKMKSVADVSLESDKSVSIASDKDICIEDLSQTSEIVVGFDSHQSTKHEFKAVVENVEKELEGIVKLQEETDFGNKDDTKVEEDKRKSEVTRTTTNRKTIPFALMGKIKKKKRASIVFVKMGMLAPYLRKSNKTVVKLVFPSKNGRKTSVGLQTDESEETSNEKVDVEVQTVQCSSSSKEVQTTTDQKSMSVQTETAIPSEMFEDFSTPKEGVKDKKQDMEVDFDTELQDELNKPWGATQAAKNDKEEVNPANDDDSELMQRVIVNIKLDLARAKDAQSPVKLAKQTEQCEESDSDIFIEQTPPREASIAGSRTEGVVQSTEESFLILSGCDENMTDFIKPETVKCVENNENDQNGLNRKRTEKDRRICIVSSGIRYRNLVQEFVDKFKVEHSNTPKKDMTHLVVGMYRNEDGYFAPYCTPKFLYAIANKKWIVSETWLKECIQSNRIMPEEPHESADPVGGGACKVARLSNGFLLEKWEVYLSGKFVSITKEDFAGLIKDCGGTIVSRLNEFSYNRKKIRMILVDGSESPGRNDYKSMATTYRTLVMSRDVAIMSIQSYQMVNFTPFIQHTFSTEECIKWGYPPELVKKDSNESDGESQI